VSENLQAKIKRLESLDKRENVIIDAIMSGKKFRAIDLANTMGLPEGTFRMVQGKVFEKLGVPETETDKRGYVFREYSEAYRERYLAVGEVKEAVNETVTEPPQEPIINISPKSRKINWSKVIIIVLGVLLVASVILNVVSFNSLSYYQDLVMKCL
jgi:hypothetical protein